MRDAAGAPVAFLMIDVIVFIGDGLFDDHAVAQPYGLDKRCRAVGLCQQMGETKTGIGRCETEGGRRLIGLRLDGQGRQQPRRRQKHRN